MQKDNKSSGFAVFIILIGICVLLLNFDILKVDMFWGVAHLWPLMLIIAGLTILFRRVRYFNIVLWLIFIGIVIGYSYLNMDEKSWFFGEEIEMVSLEEKIDTVNNGLLEVDMSQGSLIINTNADKKISYNVPNSNISSLNINTSSADMTEIILKDEKWDDFMSSFQNRKYEFNLPEEGLWTIDVDGAALDSKMDLSAIDVKSFRLDFAVGDVNLIISSFETGYYNIDFAVGDLTIDVPENLAIKIVIDGALKAIDVPKGYTSNGDDYYSPNYDASEDYILIKIDLAVGNVEIK